jgi:AAA15 family ATPase/GTPase
VEYTEHAISKNKLTKNFILNFLRQADYNITNVGTETATKNLPEEVLQMLLDDEDIPDDERERLKREKTIRLTETEFEHGVVNVDGKEEFYKLPTWYQSDGTLRTFGLAGAICEAIEENAFLAVDEIESSLHPRLVEFIIEYFFKQQGQSQLLLTTHYDGLLEEDDLLRKDSIWFANKKANGSTELYSLADFNGVNRISSLQKAYKHGKFGAIPNI